MEETNMFKPLIPAAVAAIAISTIAPTLANAGPYINGLWENGTSYQGTSYQGTTFQGSSFQGSSFQGTSFQGTSFQGTSMQGTGLTCRSAARLDGQVVDIELPAPSAAAR
jgi:uncharacterized protein YjbI with pentapeptide repeats